MHAAHTERTFLPAAGHDLFLPLYDSLTTVLGFDWVRRMLLDQAALQPGHRVLDVGCGTGSLAVLIKRLYPAVDVVGLDPDPKALARASRKAARAAAAIRFDRGFADALPYPDAAFDRVFSSMMLHHLEEREKEQALREFRRVLRPEGRLEVLDFSRPGQVHGRLGNLVHSHHRLRNSSDEQTLELLRRVGFSAPRKLRDRRLVVGHVGFFQAAAGTTGQPGRVT